MKWLVIGIAVMTLALGVILGSIAFAVGAQESARFAPLSAVWTLAHDVASALGLILK